MNPVYSWCSWLNRYLFKYVVGAFFKSDTDFGVYTSHVGMPGLYLQ